ncbi:MAG: glycerophosphodiester phosphodiesterase family protein [Candidatus Omnitrophota bacterium]|nr:glycerophosphodiester phosphodiesterase family protein [Candidatus Omnitrophota bacterium]
MTPPVLRIGHRGAKGYEPENTLLSFQKALALKVDMIEFDVFSCRSGEVVVIHNNELQPTTDGTGYVTRKTLEQLKILDAGKGQTIPTLTEVLDLIDRQAKVNIEIKRANSSNGVIHTINRYVNEQGWAYNDFIVSSFNRKILTTIRKASPHIPLGVLARRRSYTLFSFARKIQAKTLHLHHPLVRKDLLTKAHALGFNVFAWTVNTPAKIEYLIKIGVDGLFSDFPDRIPSQS